MKGLKYLYRHKIIHRDLKPENVMLNANFSVAKLIDLGISSTYDQIYLHDMHVGQAGTLRYMSPEQWQGKICLKTDVWAFGCILLEFVTGKKPYHDLTEDMAIMH